MDKYNLSSIVNYTTISRIKRAKCNRNICKTHKQLCAFMSSTKNNNNKEREVGELATYYRKLSLTSWNITDHFFLITWPLFIYRFIWKKIFENLKLGTVHDFTRDVNRVSASGTFVLIVRLTQQTRVMMVSPSICTEKCTSRDPKEHLYSFVQLINAFYT